MSVPPPGFPMRASLQTEEPLPSRRTRAGSEMGLCGSEGCASAQGGRMAEVVALALSPKPLGLKS